jgi:hypothetical protein
VKLIKLEPWEYEHACGVGIRRYTANWSKADAAHYGNKSMQEDNRTAQVAAAVCELAVAKHCNIYWSGHVWHATDHQKYKHVADVGKNIEVKRLRTRVNAPVRRHQLGMGLILFVAKPIMPELREVEIYGYIHYDQAWELGTPSDYDPDNTRLISQEHLKEYEG